MFEFHADKNIYFKMQLDNAREYVVPFIEKVFPLSKSHSVLEIGCAEGGVLKACLEKCGSGIGVELSTHRAKLAKEYLKEEIAEGSAKIIAADIYDAAFEKEFKNAFDLIILKDVIEHIHDQQRIMLQLKNYLKPGGKIFLGFPPWQMPFGGHQQVCKSKLLSKLPYYHLLPTPVYKLMLKSFGENELVIKDLIEVKETGISIERFEKILHSLNYKIDNRLFYFINPIYKYKFGLKARQQNSIVAAIPWVRNFFTTCMYYVVSV
jgi:SAM-dependent methyltransferase